MDFKQSSTSNQAIAFITFDAGTDKRSWSRGIYNSAAVYFCLFRYWRVAFFKTCNAYWKTIVRNLRQVAHRRNSFVFRLHFCTQLLDQFYSVSRPCLEACKIGCDGLNFGIDYMRSQISLEVLANSALMSTQEMCGHCYVSTWVYGHLNSYKNTHLVISITQRST